MSNSTEDYRKAKKRVHDKKAFFGHLSTYLATSIFFLVLNVLTFKGSIWFFWPMLGWGIGIVSHYFKTFGIPGVGKFDSEWEDREIKREMNKNQPVYRHDHEEELELRPLEKRRNDQWDDEDFV